MWTDESSSVRKFGEDICYSSRDVEFFLGGSFFGAPCNRAIKACFRWYCLAALAERVISSRHTL